MNPETEFREGLDELIRTLYRNIKALGEKTLNVKDF